MDDDVVVLNSPPGSELQLQSWAEQLATAIGASIRESEVGADQYCWRLSIHNRHWLLFYSALCDAVWIQALEGFDDEVKGLLRQQGYIS